MKFLSLLTVASLSVLATVSANAQLAKWTFETSSPNSAGPYSPEIGIGAGSGSHAASTTYNSITGNGSVHSYAANNWTAGDFWQFTTASTGSKNIKLDWDQTGASGAPTLFGLSFSTDGSSFTSVGNYSVSTTAWSQFSSTTSTHYSYDLSSYLGLNDASAIYFRLTDLQAGTASGFDKIDNFTISGSPIPVPEPSSMALVGLGTLAFAAVRRIRK